MIMFHKARNAQNAVVCGVLILLMSFSSAYGTILFYDDFSNGTSKWNFHSDNSWSDMGITYNDGKPSPSLLLDDHLSYCAYAISKQTFNYVGQSLTISADIRHGNAAFADQRTSNLFLTKHNYYEGGWKFPAAIAGIGLVGSSGTSNSHTVDCMLLYEENGSEKWESSGSIQIPNGDGWHNVAIDIQNNGLVDFLFDGQLVYSSSHPIISAYDGTAAITVGRRRSLYDNVSVIPEPATILLLGLGSTILLPKRKRCNR